MGLRIYVGGLLSTVTDQELRELCAPHGTVKSACVIRSMFSGRSPGYGFVEMGSATEAGQVISALNGVHFEGETLHCFSM